MRQPVGIAIEPQRRLDRRQADLVDAQRPLERIAVDARDQFLASDDEPRLRTAKQLVAGEGDEIGALRHRLGHCGLMGQAEAREIDECSGAEVVDQRHVVPVRKLRKIAARHGGGEPLDTVIRGMHLENERGFSAERLGVVLRVRAVGGTDLDEPRARARHNVGNAERAADLDQFAARDDRLASLRKRVEHKKNRRRIICISRNSI